MDGERREQHSLALILNSAESAEAGPGAGLGLKAGLRKVEAGIGPQSWALSAVRHSKHFASFISFTLKSWQLLHSCKTDTIF